MKETTKKSINQVISDFLTSNKNKLIIILGAIFLAIIVTGVVSTINKSNKNKMINSTTELDKLYSDILSGTIEESVFTGYANELISKYKGTKAELIAYSRLGSYYFDNSKFEEAAQNFELAFTNFPNDLAASVYMFNAAMAYEELGNDNKAVEILTTALELFKSKDIKIADKSADVPEILFNLGRLSEKSGDIEKAIGFYEILVAEYQNINITNLAKSRLLSFKK